MIGHAPAVAMSISLSGQLVTCVIALNQGRLIIIRYDIICNVIFFLKCDFHFVNDLWLTFIWWFLFINFSLFACVSYCAFFYIPIFCSLVFHEFFSQIMGSIEGMEIKCSYIHKGLRCSYIMLPLELLLSSNLYVFIYYYPEICCQASTSSTGLFILSSLLRF